MNAYALPTRALDYYRADLDMIPPLTREEERQLVHQLRLAREQALPVDLVTHARQRLVEGNQRLILFLARQHYRRFTRLDLEDLIQEGSLALLEATERCAFLHENFSGYASFVIRGAFTTAWTQDWPVSITRDILLDLKRRDHIRGNPLLAADSLDARLDGSEDLTLADVLDASSPSSARSADDPQKAMLVERLLGGLSARQRQVVRLRYGLEEADQREWSLREIAEQLHTSENGVRSILTHALATCRRLALKQGAASRPQPQRQRPTPRPHTEPPRNERMAQKHRERLARLQEAEQLLRERGERITGKRLASLAQGWKKLGSRRLAQAAQVSEYRAVLFLREEAARMGVESDRHGKKLRRPVVKHSAIPAFQRYELPGVLCSNQRLILNLQERILTLVEDAEGLSAQAYLPAQVLAVTRALLDAHPAPCPQATLYAAFAGVEVEEAREILGALFHAGVRDMALRGLDAALADCRAKLAAFNLGVQPVPEEAGYRLFRLSL
jgi:RNA polymerase sporulation-specific sigma factor